MIHLVPLETIDPRAIDALLDAAFGADRKQRTAYRLREGTSAIPELSRAATDGDGQLIASLQCWPVRIACDSGEDVAMVMVGPVAVTPDQQRSGIGRALMQGLIDQVDPSPDPAFHRLTLIGDPEYYGRFFGFTAARTGHWRLPGPFERHRLLARGADVPDCAGDIGPRLPAPTCPADA